MDNSCSNEGVGKCFLDLSGDFLRLVEAICLVSSMKTTSSWALLLWYLSFIPMINIFFV